MQFLDALRGIAALLVVLYHFFLLSPQWGTEGFTRNTLNLGDTGVDIFFLISGFIIPASLLRHKSLSGFWESRFFRLFPLYWFSLITALVLGFAGLLDLNPEFHRTPVRSILLNFAMIQLFTHAPLALGTYWTLCLELVFYVVCSLLFVCGVIRRALLVASLCVAGLLLGALLFGLGYLNGSVHQVFQVRWIGLITAALIGTALFRYHRGEATGGRLFLLLLFFVGSITAANWVRYRIYLSPMDSPYAGFVPQETSWLLALAVFLSVFAFRRRRFPNSLTWIGKVSYSLYLMHPIAGALTPGVLRQPFLDAVARTLVSVVLAAGTYRWIESRQFHFALRRTRQAPV